MCSCDATLGETGRPDDGRFEVIAVPHTAKWQVLTPTPSNSTGKCSSSTPEPRFVWTSPPTPWPPSADRRPGASSEPGRWNRCEPGAEPLPSSSRPVTYPEYHRDQHVRLRAALPAGGRHRACGGETWTPVEPVLTRLRAGVGVGGVGGRHESRAASVAGPVSRRRPRGARPGAPRRRCRAVGAVCDLPLPGKMPCRRAAPNCRGDP